MSVESARVLGIDVTAVGATDAIDTILGWSGAPHVAVGVNAHVCNAAARSDRFRALVDGADLCYPDGTSIVWALRALGVTCTERVATTDLAIPLAVRCAEERKGIFLLGGEPGVADEAADRFRAAAPDLRIDTAHGFLSDDEASLLVDRINASGAHVLFVGFGDPLQQEWVDRHRASLTVPAVLTCGGLFDWISGRNPRPPEWMVNAGLEWLWRLKLEPRRLARRYIVGNPAFIARFARQLISERRRRRT